MEGPSSVALPYLLYCTCTQNPHLVLNSRFPFSSSTIALFCSTFFLFSPLASLLSLRSSSLPLYPLLCSALFTAVITKVDHTPLPYFVTGTAARATAPLKTALFLITTKTKSQLLLLTALLHGSALFSPCHCDSGFSAVLDCIHSTAIPSVLLQVDFQPVREPASALSWHWHHQHQPRNPEETIVQ